MTISGTPRRPSLSTLFRAHSFVFREMNWKLYLREACPHQVYVHGGEEFERFRGEGDPNTSVEAARRAVVLAIAGMVQRLRQRTIRFCLNSEAGDFNSRRPGALKRLKKHLGQAILRAIEEGGFDGVRELADRAPQPNPQVEVPVEPRPAGLNELEELLWGIEIDPEVLRLAVLESLPEGCTTQPAGHQCPALPLAPTRDLEKAVKYVLVGPLQFQIVIASRAPFKLKVIGGARVNEVLRGRPTYSVADVARTAVAVAVRHLVETTDGHAFGEIAPAALGDSGRRLAAYRAHVQHLVTATIKSGGHEALSDLCRSGLGGSQSRMPTKDSQMPQDGPLAQLLHPPTSPPPIDSVEPLSRDR